MLKNQIKLTLSNNFYHLRKYKLLEFLDNQPSYLAKIYKRELPKNLGITRQTFATWMNAHLTDKIEIPASKLLQIAELFHVNPNDLLNFKLQKIEIKTQIEKQEEHILKITGLIK
jgi:hypothetical protein